jgi:hypothetical protein
MAITITVEDGSIVENANSFVSVADAKTYASDRGVNLGTDDDAIAAKLIVAMDYFLTFADQWKGHPVSAIQSLAWPRKYAVLEPSQGYYPSDAIPQNLVYAQVQATMAIHAGITLLPNSAAGLPVIREKVGPIDTAYARPIDLVGGNWRMPRLPTVDALLAPLINRGFTLRTLRV